MRRFSSYSWATILKVLVVTPEALVRRHPPMDAFQNLTLWLAKDEEINREALTQTLIAGGYTQVGLVEDVGTFAIRGSIIDIFGRVCPYPVRIDLFGDEIERLTLFSPENQRTLETRQEIQIGPAREILMTEEQCQLAIKKLRDLADEVEHPTKKLKKNTRFAKPAAVFGAERLMPAFYPNLETTAEVLEQNYPKDNILWVLMSPTPSWTYFTVVPNFTTRCTGRPSRGTIWFPP